MRNLSAIILIIMLTSAPIWAEDSSSKRLGLSFNAGLIPQSAYGLIKATFLISEDGRDGFEIGAFSFDEGYDPFTLFTPSPASMWRRTNIKFAYQSYFRQATNPRISCSIGALYENVQFLTPKYGYSAEPSRIGQTIFPLLQFNLEFLGPLGLTFNMEAGYPAFIGYGINYFWSI